MKDLPRLKFAHLPTPIESMPRLSAMLGGPSLLIKRDDQTGIALGGNKTRKLQGAWVGEDRPQGAGKSSGTATFDVKTHRAL